MQVEMSSVTSPWPLTQWKEGGGWLMFCCTLSDADPPPGEEMRSCYGWETGNSVLEALHLETEVLGRIHTALSF